MNMKPEEITRQYLEGKNKREQITILADMNLCEKQEIEKILKDNGCEIPLTNRAGKKKLQNTPKELQREPTPEKPKEEPQAAEEKKISSKAPAVPVKVRELVSAKMVQLQTVIDAYQEKIKEHEKELEELSGFLRDFQ